MRLYEKLNVTNCTMTDVYRLQPIGASQRKKNREKQQRKRQRRQGKEP